MGSEPLKPVEACFHGARNASVFVEGVRVAEIPGAYVQEQLDPEIAAQIELEFGSEASIQAAAYTHDVLTLGE